MKKGKQLYMLGFCGIFIGMALGIFLNKWLGYGVITLGTLFAIGCLWNKKDE